MNSSEILSAVKKAGLPPEVVAALAARIGGERGPGHPPKPWEREIAEAMTLVEEVEQLKARLGSWTAAYKGLAGRRKWTTVRTYYYRAKRLKRATEEMTAAHERLTKAFLAMIATQDGV